MSQGSGEHGDFVDYEEGGDSGVSLNDLPDELLILIFNRLIDLKCLCLCSLVSPRFSSLILLHVHSVHFAVTPADGVPTPDNPATDGLAKKTLRFFGKPFEYFRQTFARKPLPSYMVSLYGHPFFSAVDFLRKFKSIRSLHLVIPSPPNDSLFKWTAKFGASMDTFVFLSTSSIRAGTEFDFDEPGEEEDQEQEDPVLTNNVLLKHRIRFAFQCVPDAIARHRKLRSFISEHPLLENITFTDSKSQGFLSLRDSNVMEMRNWLNSLSLEAKSLVLEMVQVPANFQLWHVPVLKLPVTRKVMVSATLIVIEMEQTGNSPHQCRDWGDDDAATIATLFSEQGDEEFAEAIVEIMVNHNSRIQMLLE